MKPKRGTFIFNGVILIFDHKSAGKQGRQRKVNKEPPAIYIPGSCNLLIAESGIIKRFGLSRFCHILVFLFYCFLIMKHIKLGFGLVVVVMFGVFFPPRCIYFIVLVCFP